MILYTIFLLCIMLCMISWNNQRLLWNHGYATRSKMSWIHFDTFFFVRWYSDDRGYIAIFWPVDFY